MAYVTKKFFQKELKKTFKVLMDELGISIHEAQRTVDRKRVLVNGNVLEEKSGEIQGEIEVVVFQPNPLGLQPVFETEDFAVFDKPSGILIHPRKREEIQTLNDDIKYLFGKDANAAHRIDKGTSGLVLVSKDKKSEAELKQLFEDKEVYKEYIALVNGEVKESLEIKEKLLTDLPESKIRIKVHVHESGKDSFTKIEPIEYDKKNNVTLVKAIPQTGRQHQIRAHLFHVEHFIIGDTLYGLDEELAGDYLDGKIDEEVLNLTKSKRLLLHANRIAFEYKDIKYDIVSKVDIKKEFYDNCKF
ncbi:RluA family pseudouridine synthase [Sulfurospirillum arcachonense]|uniref:RluA family pseudouridine synthase n=1 Tax=Sulfurospirillum arcachonense TaxID=57666 RepID=UPI00046AD6CF|nr:RluA family pseudouridine synthase [Sulfurospirillum arcachonense]